jgi:hypothetical protein
MIEFAQWFCLLCGGLFLLAAGYFLLGLLQILDRSNPGDDGSDDGHDPLTPNPSAESSFSE